MSTNTIAIDAVAEEILLVSALLEASSRDDAVWRWTEATAYSAFVRYAKEKDAIPQGFDLYVPDAETLADWIAGRGKLTRKLQDELIRLLRAMQEAGSSVIEELCSFYCAYKKHLALAGDGATLLLNVASIKAILIAYTGDIFYAGGLPVTAFAAFLLHSGVLEEMCDCE